MKNIFSKTTEKRTQNGVKTDSKRTNYGIRILIFAFLTLGFGQAWAEAWVCRTTAGGKIATKTVGDKLNNGSEWNYTYKTNGGWSVASDIQVLVGTSNSSYTTVNAGWTGDDGDNKNVAANIGNIKFDKSGLWYAVGKYYDCYTQGNNSWVRNTTLSMSGNNPPYWQVNPPAVKSGTVSVSATNTASGSGTGLSSGSPIILISGMASTLTITATQNVSDANSALWCKFGTGSYSSTTTYNIASGTTTSNQTLALAVKYRNNSASLDGAETTTNIYYKWAAPAPAITFGSVTPTTLVSGSDVTLVGTRHNSSNTISFQYSTNDGASWSDITPKTSSLSSNTLTVTWTVPEAHDATQTYKFRAKLAEATPIYSSASSAVTVYGKKTIHVRNTNDWATFKMHHWGDANPTSMPGNADNISEYGGQWKDVVILSSYSGFILNDGAASGGHQSYDLSYNDYTDEAYYAFATNSTYTGGAYKHTLSSSSAPSTPTATTNDADNITSTSVVFNYSVSANRDKTTPGIAFKQSDDDIDAATIYSSGTKVAGSATNENASGSTAAQTITPGKKYYYVAYGTNGFGTSYGTVKSFVAPYKVTITKPTGCSAITPGTGTQYVHIGNEISSTAATGYTFSSWSLSEVTLSSPTTTTGVTTSTITAISADNGTIQPVYTENMTTVNLIASPADKGTFTSGGTVTSVSAGVDTHPTVTAVPGTGYHLTGTIWSESSTYISISATNTASTTITATGTKGNSANLTATFTPNTYKVQFHRNGGAGDVVKQDFTYDVAQNLTANTYTKTGYTFAGWALTTDGAVTYADGAEVSNLTSENGATFHLYAKWTPKQSALTFDYQTSAEGHGTSGSIAAVSATYNAAMPALSGTMPTAARGWAFMGFYDAAGGEGKQYYDGTGASVTTWDKDITTGTTLYAYYKKAEITTITLNHDAFEPAASATGEELLYDNDNPVVGHDPEAYTEGGTKPNQVRFSIIGLAAGGYKIRATLHIGTSACTLGTVLDVEDKSFQIASDYDVTIQYKCGDATIQASSTNPGKPLEGTTITAPEIVGYTFSYWQAGDGVTIEGADGEGKKYSAEITYTANYDGVLTAHYTRKRMIYFYNTLGWESVYVYFYNSDEYWSNDFGSGAKKDQAFNGDHKPYWEEEHGTMTQIEGTNIWYFDCNAMPVRANVAFTKDDKHDNNWFWKTKAVRRGDYNRNLPMFVPIADQTPNEKNETKYYNKGYWMNYPENTGYTLRIYNSHLDNNNTGAAREYYFPYSTDMKMPLKVEAEFNYTGKAWFMIYRNDGQLLGKDKSMTQADHETDLDSGSSNKIELNTSAPGVYTFTLSFHDDNGDGTYKYYIDVDYPVGVGDYRILYKDLATWSQGVAHTAAWCHPSSIIRSNSGSEEKADTVSLYVAYGSTPSAKFQKVTSINPSTGAVTWGDVDGGTVDLSGITAAGVYNFIVSQPAGGASISLTQTEPYTGNFYIRTDNAGTTKWDNFRANDHLMTYSEFSMSAANSFGEKYSHYYASWCERSTNIKFVVANDYSDCITDTLAQDVNDPYKNTTAGGYLKSDGAAAPLDDRYSANIRFMYNYQTNKISRAYVGSATNAARKFLILEGNNELRNESNAAITDWSPKHALILADDQNWIYERTLKILPGTRFKLYSNYAQLSVEADSAQYFRGAYESGAWAADNSKSVILIDGSGDYQMARIVYDFKTNRLLAAWIPSGADVSGNMNINADVLVEREHHEPAQYITFANSDSKLSGVKTVYGAMKFNRWILNNRQHPEDTNPDHGKTEDQISAHHPPLAAGSQKSIYERSLYFISFPFDVRVNEIFGFGHYWDEWYLEYYDGKTRAQNGYWIDSEPNWKYVTPEMASSYVLKANEGYILGLDLDFMQANNFDFWSNGISSVELFFPSTVSMETLEQTNVTIDALSEDYKCTINRGTSEGDRRVKDSYWRCIGVPSFNLYNTELKDESGNTISWKTDYTWKADESEFPFIYMWNKADNTLTAQSTSTFNFLPMHAYLVQNGGQITWTNVSAKPSSIVARQKSSLMPDEYNWRITLSRDSVTEDQTYVRLTNLEQVTDSFDFGQDLVKELNTGRGDIYTFIGYERVAANSLPIETSRTTIIPMGLNIENAGDYTFAIPEGTEGIGVTLVDNETGVRTSLSALSYTVNLTAGDYTGRFVLEISPIAQTPTGVETVTGEGLPVTGARKVMIDGILYIVKDGKMYDARGARVQ